MLLGSIQVILVPIGALISCPTTGPLADSTPASFLAQGMGQAQVSFLPGSLAPPLPLLRSQPGTGVLVMSGRFFFLGTVMGVEAPEIKWLLCGHSCHAFLKSDSLSCRHSCGYIDLNEKTHRGSNHCSVNTSRQSGVQAFLESYREVRLFLWSETKVQMHLQT